MNQEFENFEFTHAPEGGYVRCIVCGAWDWDLDKFDNLKLLVDSIKEHIYDDCMGKKK